MSSFPAIRRDPLQHVLLVRSAPDPGRLSTIQGPHRVRNLTDQIFNTRGAPAAAMRQLADFTASSDWRARAPILAHMLRKHPGERSNAMIAATALAVVGLVVVAFLNRIP